MYAFEYHRPHTLSGAVADLEKQGAEAESGLLTALLNAWAVRSSLDVAQARAVAGRQNRHSAIKIA